MKELWKRFQIGAIAVSVCTLILGLLMLFFPETSWMTLCVILGIVCVLTGVYKVIRYFQLGFAGVFFRFDLGTGILSCLAGLLLLLCPQDALRLLPMVAGIYILFCSVLDVQVAVEMRRFHLGSWLPSLVLAFVNTLLGFYLLLDPYAGGRVLTNIIGICLILGSVQNLCSILCIRRAIRDAKGDRIVDVEWEPLD